MHAASHLGRVVLDGTLGGHVAFIANEQFLHAFGGVAVDFLQPGLDIGKGVGVGDVVDDDDAVCAAVVRAGDGAEPLLAGRVPNLQLDCFALDFDRADFLHMRELGGRARTKSTPMVLIKLSVYVSSCMVGASLCSYSKAQQQTRLADARVANQQQLEQVVARDKQGLCWRTIPDSSVWTRSTPAEPGVWAAAVCDYAICPYLDMSYLFHGEAI